MKNCCIICGVEIEERLELCQSCLEFFTWKYKTGLKEEMDRFRWIKDYLEEWRLQSDEKEVEE